MRNEIGYLAEKISKQSIEGAAWLLLNDNTKVQEETYNLKMKLLTKKETELKILENSQAMHIAKMIKHA